MPSFSHLPIKEYEFCRALYAALGLALKSRLPKIGLALSGGVDSMALAYLWHHFVKSNPESLGEAHFHAFIVDHRARPESTEEASSVATRLEGLLGSKPTILSLEWPVESKATRAKNFESVARALRYKALGRACRDLNIRSLLLAHHEDDNAETALVRLSQSHMSPGLKGIGARSQLPEVRGMYAIYESGEYIPEDVKQASQVPVTGPEYGGVDIVRPLLPFPKSRLIATCQEVSVEWVEDPTNRDPTFTIRNAARKLLLSESLPRALQKPSLLNLMVVSQSNQQKLEGLAQRLFQACKIDMFDIRSGILTVQLQEPKIVFGPSTYSGWSLMYKRLVLATFLRRLTRFITPMEIVNFTALQRACDTVFSLLPPKPGSIGKDGRPMCVGTTAAGVLFELGGSTFAPDAEGYKLWYIHRQPYVKSQQPPTLRYPPLSSVEAHPGDDRDNFQLWDGRFWVHLDNLSEYPLIIEPFSMERSNAFRNALLPKERRRLVHLLDAFAPRKARWGLPCISIAPEVELGTRNRIVALPTVGIVLKDWKEKIKWDIRYKKVDMPPDMKRTLVRPMKKRHVDPHSYIFTKSSATI